jgi:hypothetical protein
MKRNPSPGQQKANRQDKLMILFNPHICRDAIHSLLYADGVNGAFTRADPCRIIGPIMAKKRPNPERIAIPMPPDLINRIDEYRWRNRLPSRAAAIRQLIEAGLAKEPNP